MLKVTKFRYNGFSGSNDPTKVMKYTATFKHWTTDPGVGVFTCSDNKERLIPTFALVDFKLADYPVQEKTGVFFGEPSKS